MAKHTLPEDWKKSCVQFTIPLRPGKSTHYAFYNVNYYPEHVETLLYRAEDIHGTVLFYALNYTKLLESDIQEFRSELARRLRLRRSRRNWPKQPRQVAVCQLGASSIAFFSFLISVKALLDVMATVWVKVADSGASRMTFGKAFVAGQKMAGGNLINWLRDTCPPSFTNRHKAASVLETHSGEWITELVKYRDNFCHHGGIPDVSPLCIMLDLEHMQSDERGTYPRTNYSEEEGICPIRS